MIFGRNIIAKDIGTDPSTLNGQKWLDEVFGYTSMDSEVDELEKKVTAKNLTKDTVSKSSKEEKENGNVTIKADFEDYGEKQREELHRTFSKSDIRTGASNLMNEFDELGIFDTNPGMEDRLNKMPEDERFYTLLNLIEAFKA